MLYKLEEKCGWWWWWGLFVVCYSFDGSMELFWWWWFVRGMFVCRKRGIMIVCVVNCDYYLVVVIMCLRYLFCFDGDELWVLVWGFGVNNSFNMVMVEFWILWFMSLVDCGCDVFGLLGLDDVILRIWWECWSSLGLWVIGLVMNGFGVRMDCVIIV